jgi:hypothetical protein
MLRKVVLPCFLIRTICNINSGSASLLDEVDVGAV